MNEAVEINLLGKVKKGAPTRRSIKRILTVASVVLSGIIIFVSVELFIVGRIFQREIENLNATVVLTEREISDQKQKEILWRTINDKLIVIQKLLVSQTYPPTVFDQFTNLVPSNVTLSSISVSETTFRAEMTSTSLFDLEVFMEDLASPAKRGNLLADVAISSIVQDKSGYIVIVEGRVVKK